MGAPSAFWAGPPGCPLALPWTPWNFDLLSLTTMTRNMHDRNNYVDQRSQQRPEDRRTLEGGGFQSHPGLPYLLQASGAFWLPPGSRSSQKAQERQEEPGQVELEDPPGPWRRLLSLGALKA